MEHHPQHDPVASEQSHCQITAEREQACKQLRSDNQALEIRVAERTVQLQTMAAQLSVAEQRERHRLAQLLHDDLLELLVGAKHNTDVLRDRPHDQKQDPYLQQVDELLDRSLDSLRSYTAQLSPPVLYEGSMGDILEWLAGWMWKDHDLAIQVDADPQANPQSEEIRIMLFHTVQELLWNVLKHAGTRNARVTLARREPEQVEITVTDKGIGFDPTVKLGQGRFGTSLSLSILRQRLEMLGGRMDIHSIPGEGTQVTLQAPTRLAGARPQEDAAAPPAPGPQAAPGPTPGAAAPEEPAQQVGLDAGRIRVLLADDHAVVRDGLARLLQMQPDMEVVARAANGLEAVDFALALKPDMIVMDANMPLLSGVQAAKRILGQLPQTKIIALSMYSVADMDLAMRQAGACEYLTKESAPEDLVATIRKHMGKPPGQ